MHRRKHQPAVPSQVHASLAQRTVACSALLHVEMLCLPSMGVRCIHEIRSRSPEVVSPLHRWGRSSSSGRSRPRTLRSAACLQSGNLTRLLSSTADTNYSYPAPENSSLELL